VEQTAGTRWLIADVTLLAVYRQCFESEQYYQQLAWLTDLADIMRYRYCHCRYVCLPVTLVIHAKVFKDVEIRFVPYDTRMSDDSSCQVSLGLGQF